ncbi:MAG: hypothetical protein AAF387_21235 [Pseudomonadota bacterium]
MKINNRIKGFSEVLKKPLLLDLDGQTLSFGCIKDFVFCVEPRVSVPARKVGDLMLESISELKFERNNIGNAEQRLIQVLDQARKHGNAIAGVRALGLKMISKDHGWRQIFGALTAADSANNEYAEVALAKYLVYLHARHEVLSKVIDLKLSTNKQQSSETSTQIHQSSPSELLSLHKSGEDKKKE